ncbi:MAG: formylglycine-generating enzyme family protein [Spirochaetia bacterium]
MKKYILFFTLIFGLTLHLYSIDNMVLVEGGTFQMGDVFGDSDGNSSELDEIVHTVTISYDYYINAYEVTFTEFDEFCRDTDVFLCNDGGFGRGNRPVINCSWARAIDYCNWLSLQEGLAPAYNDENLLIDGNGNVTTDLSAVEGYRLPTEAEWEFAARERGENVRFGNGENQARLSELNYGGMHYGTGVDYTEEGEPRDMPMPVGSYEPNSLGLYEMSGNASEWCTDVYVENFYHISGEVDPLGTLDHHDWDWRVVRGGSWSGPAHLLRTTRRLKALDGLYSTPHYHPSNRNGFRVARTVPDSGRDV